MDLGQEDVGTYPELVSLRLFDMDSDERWLCVRVDTDVITSEVSVWIKLRHDCEFSYTEETKDIPRHIAAQSMVPL